MKNFFLSTALLCGTPLLCGCAEANPQNNTIVSQVRTVAHAQTRPNSLDTRAGETFRDAKPLRWGNLSRETENITFPEGENVVVNVRRAPFGAKGDGKTDDTAAIQAAFEFANNGGSPKIIYVPNGTYIISDTIRWPGRQTRLVLQGQSERGTIFKLADRTDGYINPETPKEMIWTGDFPPQRFRNAIRNVSFNTGKGNAGAIGVRFNASNQGVLREVTIESGDGSGPIGLDMGYTGDVGPLFVKNLTVRGFDAGIYTGYSTAAQTLEGITLENQNVGAWINDGQALSIRGLKTSGTVPAFFNKNLNGFVTLIDSQLSGSGDAKNSPAIINGAAFLARNVKTTGFKSALDGSGGTGRSITGPYIGEFTSHPVQSLFPSPPRTLNLPIKETPEVAWEDPATWANVLNFAPPKEVELQDVTYGKNTTSLPDALKNSKPFKQKVWDYTEAIQQAIDSGATTVYFPPSPKGKEYVVAGKVFVRGKVGRIIGMENAFAANHSGRRAYGGEWIVEDGEAPTVTIERFDWIYPNTLLRIRTKRNVVIASIPGARFDIGEGANVFLEDVVAAVEMKKGATVYARQFNTEYTDEARHFIDDDAKFDFGQGLESRGNFNDGGTLWVLGIKTEGDGTIVSTINGGKTEVLGALIYANKAINPNKKMFVSQNSSISISIRESLGRNQPFHPIVETRDGQTKIMKPVPGGITMPLYTGYKGEGAVVPVAAAPVVPLPAGSGTGLKAEIFSDTALRTVKTTRTDSTIDYDWTNAGPDGAGLKDYSVRWTGFIEPRVTGAHSFPLSADGMRLMIGDTVANTSWLGGVRYRNGGMYLEAGKKYPIRLERRALNDKAKVSLVWTQPGSRAETVPTSQLYPPTATLPTVSLSTSKVDVIEGSPVEFILKRDGDLSKPLEVRLAPRVETQMPMQMRWAARGSAVANYDFAPFPETFTFAANQAELKVPIKIIEDSLPEPDKTVVLDLDFQGHYNAAGGAKIYIKDNDAPPAGTGTGLKAEYFDDQDLKELKGARVDPQIRFSWDKAAPFPGVVTETKPKGPHGFSARWTGEIQPQYSENYRFHVVSGSYGAVRLWIGDKMVADTWAKNGSATVNIALEKGKKYPIKLEYKATNFYGANLQMLWSSASQYEQAVPATQLYPSPYAQRSAVEFDRTPFYLPKINR